MLYFGGLARGDIPSSRVYYIYVIRESIAGQPAAVFGQRRTTYPTARGETFISCTLTFPDKAYILYIMYFAVYLDRTFSVDRSRLPQGAYG